MKRDLLSTMTSAILNEYAKGPMPAPRILAKAILASMTSDHPILTVTVGHGETDVGYFFSCDEVKEVLDA